MEGSVEYLEQQVNELEVALREARASLNISPNSVDMKREELPLFPAGNPYISPDSIYAEIKEEEVFTSFDDSIIQYDGYELIAPAENPASDSYLWTPSSGTSEFNNSTSESPSTGQELVLFSSMPSSSKQEENLKDHTWSITMTKEGLTINTNVKSVKDLVAWGLEAIRVLNLESQVAPCAVDLSEYSGNIKLSVTTRLLGVKDLYADVIRNNRKTLMFDNETPQKPILILTDPHKVVSSLLATYFQCHNKQMAILHQKTFMEEDYDQNNPLSSPVVMSLCSYVCLRHCRHMPPYTSQELREFGEFFYKTARDLLEDIFDDPDYRHEAMNTFTFLGMFRLHTLRVSEAFTAFSLGYTIALDLYDEMMSLPVVDEKSLIRKELFKRQYFHAAMVEHHVYHIVEKSFKDFNLRKLSGPLQALPGEGPDMFKSIKLKNAFILWISDQRVLNARREIHMLDNQDGPGTLSLKNYFQYQEMITGLWKDLDPEFRIVDDPDILPSDTQLIDADRAQLQTFIMIHVWYILVNSLFLPKQLFSTQDGEAQPVNQSEFTTIFVESISVRSLERCLKSSSVVISLAEQQIRHNICRFEPLYLLLVIDLNMRLAKADRRPDIAKIGHENLERCVDLLKASMFAPMHGVLLEEGKSITDPNYQPPPITQSLKEQIEKMLIPFGISV
ncbi:hypothetical protein Unana1_08469 [Umbelopsis nana]